MKLVRNFLNALALVLVFVSPAFANDGGASSSGLGEIAAGLAIAIAAFGGAISQGKTVCSALDGIARNPGSAGQMFVPMILGLVLIESLVIYALVISMKIVGIF